MSKSHISRMRVFAGPNGSGKSTIIKEIQKNFYTGPYVNADEIEKQSRDKGFINIADYTISSSKNEFDDFLKSSTLLRKAEKEGYQIQLSFSDNIITVKKSTNSYESAIIAEYIRNILINNGETFSFETVMSHPSKLELLQSAKDAGFKNYLYFISTESADINVDRVIARVTKGGHPVNEQKIRERYVRSMDLLCEMLPYCHRCFIFDNSLEAYRLIAEIVDGTEIHITSDDIPQWVEVYLFNKLGV